MASASSKASCTRCGIKHPRPVGIRCKRTLNSSAPTMPSNQSVEEEDINSSIRTEGEQQAATDQQPDHSGSAQISQVESKLDLILKKVQKLESKNQFLERSHHCSNLCDAKALKRKKAHSKVHIQPTAESSDEDSSFLQQSSVHTSQVSEGNYSCSHP